MNQESYFVNSCSWCIVPTKPKSKFKRLWKPTQDYPKYKSLIHNLAWRYHQTTGIELDELIGWANLKFVECQKGYDPLRSSFGTWLTIQISGLFLEMDRKRCNDPLFINIAPIDYEAENVWNEPINQITPENYLLFKEILQDLSSDAKEVVNIVFNTPMDIINSMPTKYSCGVTKYQIEKYLWECIGWDIERIWITSKEISASLA